MGSLSAAENLPRAWSTQGWPNTALLSRGHNLVKSYNLPAVLPNQRVTTGSNTCQDIIPSTLCTTRNVPPAITSGLKQPCLLRWCALPRRFFSTCKVKMVGKHHTMALEGLHGKVGQIALTRKADPGTSLRDLDKLQGPFWLSTSLKGKYNWWVKLLFLRTVPAQDSQGNTEFKTELSSMLHSSRMGRSPISERLSMWLP